MTKYRNFEKCYIIAEIGVNHNGILDDAKKLVELAVNSGADAVKFQSFRANELARVETPKVGYQVETTGNKTSHYEMLKSLELTEEEEKELITFCELKGINFISTPYSVRAVKQLDKLGVSEFKVASADIIDIPLLEAIAKTGKPVILSLGMATLGEVERAISCFRNYKNSDIALLHCVSNYPCSDESLNLKVIDTLKNSFPFSVGFSDHSEGDVAAIASIVLGCSVIEKHFTSDKNLEGPDHRASEEPKEFAQMVQNIRRIETQLGVKWKKPQIEELDMKRVSRKSVVYSRSIEKGKVLEVDDFTMKRPGGGLEWDDVKNFIGQKIKYDCKKDDQVNIRDVE